MCHRRRSVSRWFIEVISVGWSSKLEFCSWHPLTDMHFHVCALFDYNSDALPSGKIGDLNIKGFLFFFLGCILVSRCSSDPAEGAFCQDFIQNCNRAQAGATRGDRYQRLPFLLPDCMLVPRSLPSELKISVWQRKTSHCHRWLQLRDQQEQIYKYLRFKVFLNL